MENSTLITLAVNGNGEYYETRFFIVEKIEYWKFINYIRDHARGKAFIVDKFSNMYNKYDELTKKPNSNIKFIICTCLDDDGIHIIKAPDNSGRFNRHRRPSICISVERVNSASITYETIKEEYLDHPKSEFIVEEKEENIYKLMLDRILYIFDEMEKAPIENYFGFYGRIVKEMHSDKTQEGDEIPNIFRNVEKNVKYEGN